MISTTQQLKIADMQMEQLKRQITHTKLVEKEVESLPKDTKTYEGVGRMYVFLNCHGCISACVKCDF